MSILLGGLSGRYVGAAAASTGLSIRAQILADIEETLRLVASTAGRVAPGAGNTAGVTAAPGGTYTGTVTRRYLVTVVTAGASGTARVTVTDDTPAAQKARWTTQDAADVGSLDDGPVASVVTSGTAVALGTAGLGATLTLTWSGSLALGDSWHVWVGPYATPLAHVTRKMNTRIGGYWIEMQVPIEDSVPGPISKQTNDAIVVLACYTPRSDEAEGDIEAFLADVTHALRLDITRSALAVNTIPLGNVGAALDETRQRGFFDLRVQVLYRHRDNDARQL